MHGRAFHLQRVFPPCAPGDQRIVGITGSRTSKYVRSMAAGYRGIFDQRLQGLGDSLHYSDMCTSLEGYAEVGVFGGLGSQNCFS
jgi:hypothetical protein